MKLSQKGLTPILILLAAFGIIIFLLISSTAPFKNQLFSILFPKPSSHAVSLPIVFKSSSGEILPINASGIPLTTSAKIKVELTASVGIGTTESVGIGTTELVGIGTTESYRIAESIPDLDNATYLPYVTEPTVIDYTFKNTSLGSKVIWVDFKDSINQVDRNAAQIELISPTPTSSPTPSSTPTPSPTPTPKPSATVSPTPTPTAKPTPSLTPKPSPTPTPKLSPTPKPTPPSQSAYNTISSRQTIKYEFSSSSPSADVISKNPPCGLFCNIGKLFGGINKAIEKSIENILESVGLLPSTKELKSF